jgi:hypothetical protein
MDCNISPSVLEVRSRCEEDAFLLKPLETSSSLPPTFEFKPLCVGLSALTLALKQQPINIELIQQHRTVGVSDQKRETIQVEFFNI